MVRNAYAQGLPKSAIKSFDVADVNNDNKIDLNDYIYLSNYLAGRGPKPPLPFPNPAFATAYYCTASPCLAVLDNQLVRYTAQKISQGPDSAVWEAVATNPSNNNTIAQYRVEAKYGPQTDTFTISYQRAESPFGSSISLASAQTGKPATYHYEGAKVVRDQIDVIAALRILNDLLNAEAPPALAATKGLAKLITPRSAIAASPKPGQPGGGNQNFPRCPNGCSGPVNMPPIKTTPAQDGCCNEHDECFAKGGGKAEKDACDKALSDCLKAVTPTWCKVVGNLPPFFNPISRCIGDTFSNSAFRWNDEKCTCNVDTTNDPNACAFGKDKKNASKGDGTIIGNAECSQNCPCSGSCTVSWPQPDGSTATSSYDCVSGAGATDKPQPTPSSQPTPSPQPGDPGWPGW